MDKETLKNKVNEILRLNSVCELLFYSHGCITKYQLERKNFTTGSVQNTGRWLQFLDFLTDNNLTIKSVAYYGGEDMGSEYWSVYEFKSLDTNASVLVKFEGWYASHVGSEYQSWKFVEPVTVTHIEYQ